MFQLDFTAESAHKRPDRIIKRWPFYKIQKKKNHLDSVIQKYIKHTSFFSFQVSILKEKIFEQPISKQVKKVHLDNLKEDIEASSNLT